MNRFQEQLETRGFQLIKGPIEILQVNLGKLCNLTCVHCHVEAGPTKTKENMDRTTAEAVVAYMKNSGIILPPRFGPKGQSASGRYRGGGIKTLDLTGGAPEMNPNFRYLVTEAKQLGFHVIDRCNLTVLFLPGQEDLGQFLADSQVEIIASLPCYLQVNVDKQRGKGTFDESIKALQRLNDLGYGKENSGLALNLVYNPVDPQLPPNQDDLEKDYKERLKEDWGIVFNQLYTITNMPITRYAKYLKALNQYEDYQELLIHSFNPSTLDGLMCRNTLSVGWDGRLYDCDFNQMLGMSIRNVDSGTGSAAGQVFIQSYQNKTCPGQNRYRERRIETGNHCFGCTAGSGSSCQGAVRI